MTTAWNPVFLLWCEHIGRDPLAETTSAERARFIGWVETHGYAFRASGGRTSDRDAWIAYLRRAVRGEAAA